MNITHEILTFWFAPGASEKWFNGGEEFDAEITRRFRTLYETAPSTASNAEEALAMVILLDQFPRNMFRNSPNAFATDARALEIAKHAIAQGWDQLLPTQHRHFLYLPFMHSEQLAEQDRGLELFSALGKADALDYMKRHRDIITRFGRFPHRNIIMGRKSTAEELAFLTQPGSSF